MKFGVILADPPWQYSNRGCRGAAENEYPTMSTVELCKLKVEEASEKDAVLLLWTTWPFMIDAFKVIESWGFTYKTGLPWIKVQKSELDLWGEWFFKTQFGVGFWARGVSEPLLIATRGQPSLPDKTFIGLLSPNISHSRKPDNIYEYAESLNGPYLEMFCRRPRKGWSIFGNEFKSDVEL